MALIEKQKYTSKDYWNLPEDRRAELIDGKFYNMAPPGTSHQKICGKLYQTIANYIDSRNGDCG